MADVEKKVLETMKKAGKPMKAGEVAEAAGLDKKDVTKALGTMKKAGKVTSPKACYYAVAG